MRDQSIVELRSNLLEHGIAPRYVRRISAEISDHLDDLRLEALADGLSADEAEVQAINRLGETRIIAESFLGHPELKTWLYRFPRVARIYLPIAYVLLLPAGPVIAGIRNPALVVRWGTALMLSGIITAAMFLFMQLSIVLA